MKVALVYDRVNKWGGAERVLLALHKLFSSAPLYTSVFWQESASWAQVFPKVIPSFLQNFPFAKSRHDLYAILMPLAFESFNFSGYDLVISVSSEAAKGVITGPDTYHLNYMLTPTRYLWSGSKDYFSNFWRRVLSAPALTYLRSWDITASNRPDKIVSISKEVASRVKRYYGKESRVVYPPVDVSRFSRRITNWRVRSRLAKNGISWGEYYLVVGRLVPYKKVDLVIETFNRLKWQLVVAGNGSEESVLRKAAGNNVHFAGKVEEQDLPAYYQGAKALVLPQNEDFGLVSVEAQAAGRPVIAYRAGGALETVKENVTGMFFDEQSIESLSLALNNFKRQVFLAEDCLKNANNFTEEKFAQSFVKLVGDLNLE